MAKRPNALIPQEPNDIGDHHFSIGQPRCDWKSICQKRSGRPKSMLSSTPLMMMPTSAT
jgi:hypothetical protein